LSNDRQRNLEAGAQPRLAAFFSKRKVNPSAFVKAVRNAKLARFDDEDVRAASSIVMSSDNDGKQLFSLLCQPQLPEAISTWIWPITEQRLSGVFGLSFDDLDEQYSTLLSGLQRKLPTVSLRGKATRGPSLTWVRVAAKFLTRRPHPSTLEVYETLARLFSQREQDAARFALAPLQGGADRDFQQVVAVAHVWLRLVQNLTKERDEEHLTARRFEARLESALEQVSETSAEAAVLRQQNVDLQDKLASEKHQFEKDRQHWGYDFRDFKEKTAAVIRDRVLPLLEEAMDALEVKPPESEAAARRLKRITSALQELPK
jgi:hypothetical protein